MASSKADSRLSLVLIPALDKIIKNASWRKHSKLAHECKSVIDRFLTSTPSVVVVDDESEPNVSIPGPLHDGGSIEFSLADSESILSPLISACGSGFLKIADPTLDAIQKLIAHGYLRGESDPSGGDEAKLLAKLMESVCKCHDLGDDVVELMVLKTLLSAVTSTSLRIHGASPMVGLSAEIFKVGLAASNASAAKVEKRDGSCRENQHNFIPFAFDTFGLLGSEAVELLRRVHKVMDSNVMTVGSNEYVFRRLGFAIQKGLATQFVVRLSSTFV